MVGRLRAYMAVVSAIGFVVLALLAASVDLDRVRDSLPEGAMLALVVLVAPFLSIPLSRDGRGPSIHVDTPFVFALALAAGAGAAALVMAASGVLYDLAHRKPFSKVAFNDGTHTIGLAAGALVWTTLAGGQVTGSSALPAILAGTAVFVAVKWPCSPRPGPGRVRPAGGQPARFLRQWCWSSSWPRSACWCWCWRPSARPCCCWRSARCSAPTCCCAARAGRCWTATTPRRRPGGRPSCGPRSRRWPASSRRPTR